MADNCEKQESLVDQQDRRNAVEELYRSLQERVNNLKERVSDITDETHDGQTRIILKLGTRVRELENLLEDEQHRHAETQRHIRQTERGIRELTEEVEENRKNKLRLQNVITSLEARSDTLKKLVDEAETAALECGKTYTVPRRPADENGQQP